LEIKVVKILLATDGSDYSRAAVEKACRLVIKPTDTAIKIVSVYQAYVPLDMYPQTAQYIEDFARETRKVAEVFANEAASAIQKCFPEIEISTEVKMGASDRVIIETAAEWNADLIIVGSHGRGFWGRTMIGSVSDSVIHHASCSVMVVRSATKKAAAAAR
jgi:nucleotide-binding universal stress UspA family protein